MTWLPGVPDGDTDWDRVAALAPDLFAAIAEVVDTTWDHVDPVLLELARLRIATLLEHAGELSRRSTRAAEAGLSETKVAALPHWPTSPEFSDGERACLALTEQFVLDANGVTDDAVDKVTAHLGAAGCYVFVEAVSVLETFQRTCLTLGISTVPSVDRLVGCTATSAEEHA